jgi:hypothetical protein
LARKEQARIEALRKAEEARREALRKRAVSEAKGELAEANARGGTNMAFGTTAGSIGWSYLIPGYSIITHAGAKAASLIKAPVTYARALALPLTDNAAQICACLSTEVYKAPEKRDQVVRGFKLLSTTNKREDMVAYFKSSSDGKSELIVAYRGTSTLHDVLVKDVLIALVGAPSQIISEALGFFEESYVAATSEIGHPIGKVRVTGHSLGGATAHSVLRRIVGWRKVHDLRGKFEESHIFNPGSGPGCGGGGFERDTVQRLVDGRIPLTVHRIVGDPVSSGVYTWTTCIDYHKKKQAPHVHSMANFL